VWLAWLPRRWVDLVLLDSAVKIPPCFLQILQPHVSAFLTSAANIFHDIAKVKAKPLRFDEVYCLDATICIVRRVIDYIMNRCV